MKKSIRLIGIALATAFVTQAAWSQVPLKDLTSVKWWTNKRVAQELRLSPEQQSRIESAWMQSRRDLVDQKAELDKRQSELTAMLEKDTSDEAAVTKAFEEVQQARVNLERTSFVMRLRIKNLLSQEQQPKIEGIAERLRQQRAKAGTNAAPARANLPVKKSGR